MGCGASLEAQTVEPSGDGKSSLCWMPNEVVHKLARKRDNLGSIECQMLVNQLAIFKALQRGSGDMLALPFPPDSACVDMALAGTAGSREGKMLVNQEVLFHKLCGEEIADMPHAPVGDEAKECIKELPAAPNARSARRRSSLQRGSREARLALNQHAFNSRINGIPVPALPGPAAKEDEELAQKWIGPNYSDKETSDVLKCRMLMNQTALFNCMCATGKRRGSTTKLASGCAALKWKKSKDEEAVAAPTVEVQPRVENASEMPPPRLQPAALPALASSPGALGVLPALSSPGALPPLGAGLGSNPGSPMAPTQLPDLKKMPLKS